MEHLKNYDNFNLNEKLGMTIFLNQGKIEKAKQIAKKWGVSIEVGTEQTDQGIAVNFSSDNENLLKNVKNEINK